MLFLDLAHDDLVFGDYVGVGFVAVGVELCQVTKPFFRTVVIDQPARTLGEKIDATCQTNGREDL